MKKKKKIHEYIENKELNIEEIVKEYSNYVQAIIRNKISFNQEDTEEIISDVFLTLWNNQDKLDINKKLSLYIAGITKNLIKKKCKTYKQTENISDYEEKLILSETIALYSETEEKNEIIINEIDNGGIVLRIIASIFYKVLYMGIMGTLIGVSILIIRKLMNKKISPRCKCIMLGIMMILMITAYIFH